MITTKLLDEGSTSLSLSAPAHRPGSAPYGDGGDASSSWPHFEKIFMVSALTGDGVDELKVRLSVDLEIQTHSMYIRRSESDIFLDQCFSIVATCMCTVM